MAWQTRRGMAGEGPHGLGRSDKHGPGRSCHVAAWQHRRGPQGNGGAWIALAAVVGTGQQRRVTAGQGPQGIGSIGPQWNARAGDRLGSHGLAGSGEQGWVRECNGSKGMQRPAAERCGLAWSFFKLEGETR